MLIGIDGNEANISRRVGVNQFALGLLTALSRLKSPHNFVVYLKSPPLSDLPPTTDSWKYRVIPFPKLWTQTRLPFDLFTHFPRPDVFFTPSHYAPRWSPVPTIVSIMDLGFLDTPREFTSRDFNQLKYWTNYSVKKARKIITISEFSKKEIIKKYKIPESDITVVYPGYDKDLFKPTIDPAVLSKYGVKKPYIFFISSLKPNKNVAGLVQAFSTLKTPHLLVIAGKKAWLYDEIFHKVQQLKIENRIVFAGFVDEADVPALMSQADCFVLPSFYEGFGIPVIEAMACGVPVVVSAVASLPEAVGQAGVLVDPHRPADIAQGIKTALSGHGPILVKLGLEQAQKFDWSDTARKTLRVLEQS